MSNQPRGTVLYTYRKTGAGGAWRKSGIPFGRGQLQGAIRRERQAVEQTRAPSTGVVRTRGAQRMWWAIIEVDEDTTPAEEMTEQEIRQQNVIANG